MATEGRTTYNTTGSITRPMQRCCFMWHFSHHLRLPSTDNSQYTIVLMCWLRLQHFCNIISERAKDIGRPPSVYFKTWNEIHMVFSTATNAVWRNAKVSSGSESLFGHFRRLYIFWTSCLKGLGRGAIYLSRSRTAKKLKDRILIMGGFPGHARTRRYISTKYTARLT